MIDYVLRGRSLDELKERLKDAILNIASKEIARRKATLRLRRDIHDSVVRTDAIMSVAEFINDSKWEFVEEPPAQDGSIVNS